MILTHLLLTRFSYSAAVRGDPSIIKPDHTTVNPLTQHRLEKRFKLFETFCLPSVLRQTTQDFTWILIVDPSMRKSERERLQGLTRPHERTHLVEYDPSQELGRLHWLRPYFEESAPTHIATTNADDDDLMSVNFIDYVQRHLRQLGEQQQLPPCYVVACTNPPQWDLIPSRRAPLGYVKPWHRGGYPTFAGYTLCCSQPEFDLSALAFEHTVGAAYFDPGTTLRGDATQIAIRAAAERAGHDWKTWHPHTHLHIVQSVNPQVVVVNHLENDQATRAFERWSTRRPVTGPADFPEMAVAYDKLPATIRAFRRTPLAALKHFYRGLRLLFSSHPVSRRHRWQVLYMTLTVPVWYVTGLPERNLNRRLHH